MGRPASSPSRLWATSRPLPASFQASQQDALSSSVEAKSVSLLNSQRPLIKTSASGILCPARPLVFCGPAELTPHPQTSACQGVPYATSASLQLIGIAPIRPATTWLCEVVARPRKPEDRTLLVRGRAEPPPPLCDNEPPSRRQVPAHWRWEHSCRVCMAAGA
jgi:hypothetical protein